MFYSVEISGIRPIIMHSGRGVDTNLAATIEIKSIIERSLASTRTDSDTGRIEELECQLSLWLDRSETPTIPATPIRSCVETGARKLKQGPAVREGLAVDAVNEFFYDREKYGITLAELGKSTQFRAAVVVNRRSRIIHVRAMFEQPWSCKFTLVCDDELIDQDKLTRWIDIAVRRIGLGDWRPEKSGDYGRFDSFRIVRTGSSGQGWARPRLG